MMSELKILLEARDIHYDYDGVVALSEVGLDARRGEILGVIGPNGAGKSTLLKILAGLISPKKGQVLINGEPLSKHGRRELARIVAWIPQSESRDIPLSVYGMVSLGRYAYRRGLVGLSSHDREVIEDSLRKVDMVGLKDRWIFQLSGGEAQRAILARALAQEPLILLLDEPASHLDLHHRIAFGNIVSNLVKREGKAAIWVSHDLNLALRFSQRLLLLDRGKVVSFGEIKKVLKEEVLEEIYRIPLKVFWPPETPHPMVIPV